MQDIQLIHDLDPEVELDRLAAHYHRANGEGIKLLNRIGGQAEGLLERLPDPVRAGLEMGTEQALHVAVRAAQGSRRAVPDQREWVNTALSTAMGAAGGFGGLSTALWELPATTTLLLRAIQGVAAENGFDPSERNVQFDSVRVFSSAGPLEEDDGADLGFLSARVALTGNSMQRLISFVTPRLARVLGQKLAAQAVPVMGAVTGAGTNFLYARYYQQVAHVHFGLRRLSMDADIPRDRLVRDLAQRMQRLEAAKSKAT
ncbi:EcsC family protein [Lutimaribacter marinistellae]|uniref:EcsC family protein n=1 Tax=Lutimaribacter marinistellae TaxID=1820329 RepID=A0ABV7TM10_9RHOB